MINQFNMSRLIFDFIDRFLFMRNDLNFLLKTYFVHDLHIRTNQWMMSCCFALKIGIHVCIWWSETYREYYKNRCKCQISSKWRNKQWKDGTFSSKDGTFSSKDGTFFAKWRNKCYIFINSNLKLPSNESCYSKKCQAKHENHFWAFGAGSEIDCLSITRN